MNKLRDYLCFGSAAMGIFLIVVMSLRRCSDEKAQPMSRAIDTVNIGTTANDGTGDPLRTAFIKVNAALYMIDSLGIDALTADDFTNLANLLDSLNIHVDVNDTASMLTNYALLSEVSARINDTIEARLAAAEDWNDYNYDGFALAVKAAGGSVISFPAGGAYPNTQAALTDGELYMVMVNVRQDTTITGVKFINGSPAGDYTADNNCKVGLYSSSGGTATLVASCANDGNLFKGTAYTATTKAFSSAYSATAGVYYIALLYNSSAVVSAPETYKCPDVAVVTTYMMTNNKLAMTVAAQTDLPATVTISSATTTEVIRNAWIY